MRYHPGRVARDTTRYVLTSSNTIILGADGRLIMQRRTADAPTWPSAPSFWGGAPEGDEDFDAAMRRELREELGIDVPIGELVYLGSHEYEKSEGLMLAARYFWHDREWRVQDCYEGSIERVTPQAALADPSLHKPGTQWIIEECLRRGLVA